MEEVPAAQHVYPHQCRLCYKTFENTPIACEHLMFCKSCLEEYHLSDSMVLVCTRCSMAPYLRKNQQWDLQQDILSLMHLRAKSKRGNCGDRAIHLLCQELNEVLNLSGTKPCLKGCGTCNMIKLSTDEVKALTGPDGNTVIGPNGNTVIGPYRKTVSGPNRITVVVKGKFTCKSENVIYFIYCRREGCGQAYVGQTTRKLLDRMREHRYKIRNTSTTLLVKHFKGLEKPYHTLKDCKVCVLQGYPAGTVLEKEEVRLIDLLGTKAVGLNMV